MYFFNYERERERKKDREKEREGGGGVGRKRGELEIGFFQVPVNSAVLILNCLIVEQKAVNAKMYWL